MGWIYVSYAFLCVFHGRSIYCFSFTHIWNLVINIDIMDCNPKDTMILDKGSPTEEPVIVYMTSENIAVVRAMDGSDIRVKKDRLTKPE